MAYLLRVIRKSRWYRDENTAWLGEGEFQADAFSDLKTTGNTLSLWVVADDRSNLEQVVSALAATRESITNLDYALLDQKFVTEGNLRVASGNSPYSDANMLHRDLTELSATRLYILAKNIFENAERNRYSEKDILKLLAHAIANGHIDRSKLKMAQSDMEKIERLITQSRLN